MWTFKNEDEEHLLVSSDQSSHIFKLSNRSQTKVALSEVEEKFDRLVRDELTLVFVAQLDLQITQFKIIFQGEVRLDSDFAFEAATIGR